jgi:hypothetical protein
MPIKKFEAGKPLESQLTATRLNELVDAINSATLKEGTGIRLTRNDAGTTVSAIKKREALDIRPFTPYLKEIDGGLYQISFAIGYVIECVLSQTNSIIELEVEGIIDSDGLPIWHDISQGQCAYVQAQVGSDGKITGKPKIVISEPSKAESSHYFPEVGDYTGADGSPMYKLCEFRLDDSRIKNFQAGQNILHFDERVTMRNLTSGSGVIRNVLKSYLPESDTVDFRTLSQLGGDGEPVMADGDGDTIEFRRVKDLGSHDAQVTVEGAGDAILVRGNSIDGTLSWKDCDGNSTQLIEWKDGLIITAGAVEFEAGCTGSETPTGSPP